jgi:maltose alpha-D-glucosyltransferase/alpha-amylase
VANQGDGWTWTLDELGRYLDACSSAPGPPTLEAPIEAGLLALAERPDEPMSVEHLGLMLDAAARLGRRTAEMHLALAAETADPAFVPAPLQPDDLVTLAGEFRTHASHVFDRLRVALSQLPDDVVEPAGLALSRRRLLLERFGDLESLRTPAGQRIRVHGDYHLGQVLRVMQDYMILDFEGEPARSLAERRTRHSPLKDVAGMLRSFSYAAWTGLLSHTYRRADDLSRLEPWARLWERSTIVAFLRAYRAAAGAAPCLPADGPAFETMLGAYVLDKTLYELAYELDNRPTWVRVPLRGLLAG